MFGLLRFFDDYLNVLNEERDWTQIERRKSLWLVLAAIRIFKKSNVLNLLEESESTNDD